MLSLQFTQLCLEHIAHIFHLSSFFFFWLLLLYKIIRIYYNTASPSWEVQNGLTRLKSRCQKAVFLSGSSFIFLDFQRLPIPSFVPHFFHLLNQPHQILLSFFTVITLFLTITGKVLKF